MDEDDQARSDGVLLCGTAEDLRVVETATPTASEVFLSDQRTVNNVLAEYT